MAGNSSWWRYEISTLDYDRLRGEIETDPIFGMREEETYYEHMRRMEMIMERARDMRDVSADLLIGESGGRDVRGRRPRVYVATSPTSAHYHRPPRPTFSSPRVSSTSYIPSSSPHASVSRPVSPGLQRPTAPRLGVIYRAPLRSPGYRERERSWSPIFRYRELSPRGYTGIATDSDDLAAEESVQGGVSEEPEGVPLDAIIIESHSGSAVPLGSQPGEGIGLSQSSVEVELEMWMRGTPVEEVVMLSDPTEEDTAEEPIGPESEEQVEDDTSGGSDDSIEDPDYVAETTQVLSIWNGSEE